MRCHGVAVIELAEGGGVEGDCTLGFAIHLHGKLPILDAGDAAKIAIGDAKFLAGSGELDTVAGGELTVYLTEDVDSPESSRIVGHARPVGKLHSEHVGAGVNGTHAGKAVSFDAFGFAAGGVLEHIACVISCRQGAVGTSHVRAVRESTETLAVLGQRAILQ